MVTVQQVYDLSLALIDEVTEEGRLFPDNPEYYESKAKSFLTILQAELTPINQAPTVINDLSENLTINDRVCLTVLPYGLAAHLLMQEDPNTASFFNSRYDELKRKMPSKAQPIQDVYGISEVMQTWQQ